MNNMNINFSEEKFGYNRGQVDSYIKMLSGAYEETYTECQEIQRKYNNLLEERRDTREQPELSTDIITKTLINTEILAQKIIADAQAEVAAAKMEAKRMLEEAELISSGARRNLEQAREAMERAAGEVYKLLTFAAPEPENAAGL